MKRIKQIEESKRMISDALMRLLQNDSLEDITISQIAAEACIGRNTFYSHFQKKEDILRYVMEDLFMEARKTILDKPNPSLRDWLLWRFSLILNNPLLHILHKEQDIRLMLIQFRESRSFDLGAAVDDYTKEFILGGIDAITLRWIKNGMSESPEEMAHRVMTLISH